MSDEQRREYDEILSGVEIDDHTFHVIDHENGTKGTIAILDEISQKLLAFRKTIQDFEFIMDIEDKKKLIHIQQPLMTTQPIGKMKLVGTFCKSAITILMLPTR